MKIEKVHCFFEQSGTFRDAFRSLNIAAEDYDIRNDFGQTDHVMDLFAEINKAYDDKASVFDGIGEKDLVMAFFPCVRFSEQAQLWFMGNNYAQQNRPLEKKLAIDLKFHEELHDLYSLITKLALTCLRKNLRLIIENPYSSQHYLVKYWALKASIIDEDRTRNGDYYKKPTQFFFVNCKPEQNFLFEPLFYSKPRTIEFAKDEGDLKREVVRSLIHPQYALRFIKMYVVDQELSENAVGNVSLRFTGAL